VVDFWAAWCGPCRALGPVLEREVEALGEKVELVKVDTDQNPELAARYQIRGIPAVKAFRGGRVVDEFVGAQPAALVREFLQSLVPSEAELSAQSALAKALSALQGGRLDEVESQLSCIDPRSPLYERSEPIRNLLGLYRFARDYGGVERARSALAKNEADLEARYALGCALAAQGDLSGALEQLLEIVTRSRKFREDAGRTAMLTIFQHPTADPELVREFRRRLQIVT
jgi:putative thioredoxin